MKKLTFLLPVLLFLGFNLSVLAQQSGANAKFYQYYKNAVSDKTAIITANPALYQKALESGWFKQMEAGLKNAENFSNGSGGGTDATMSENGTCATATPFCTQSGETYPAGVNTGEGEAGPNYGCLGSEPNPAWLFLKILTGGDLHITETNSNNIDVDFILWGPFSGPTCGSSLSAGTIVDCSYSSVATEYIDIASCVAGQYYMLLITNFSNNNTNITLAKTSGSATTDCSITQVPRPPVTSAGTSITGTSFSANWTGYPSDPFPATSFVLDVSTDPNFGSFFGGYNNFDVGLATTWPITGCSPGTTYYYRLRGVNANGQSANSTRITVNTLSCLNPTSGGSIAADQTHCDTFTPAAFTSTAPASGETGTIEYKWQWAVSPFSSWTDIPSSNSATYAPGSVSVTTKYKRLARVNCMNDWTGAAESNAVTVTINPLPAVFTVTGGTFCATHSSIGLSGSVTGINYALYNGASLVTTLAGTGSALNFGTINVAGTYTVVATDATTLCPNNMTGSSLVNPLPTPVISGDASVTQNQTVTYSTPYYPGHLYTWTASHGNAVVCTPNRNCLTITWDFPCGIISPGFVRVTETIVATGCTVTTEVPITIVP